jgi:preprotein translocase subunit SecD
VAPPAGTLRVGRYFVALLGLFAVLYGVVFWPGQPRAPKLGLDLQGGAQVILKAQTQGGKVPTKAAMNQARQIITDRVNGRGVSSAEVLTQGSDRIVVSIPGKGVEDLKDVGSTALLEFRPAVLDAVAVAPATTPAPSGSTTPSGTAKPSTTPTPSTTAKPSGSASTSASPHGRVVPRAAGSTTPAPASTPASSPAPSATPSSSAPAADTGELIDQWKNLGFAPPTTNAAFTALTPAQQQQVQAFVAAWPCDDKTKALDVPEKPLISCDEGNTVKYLLGPVIVRGTEIKSADAVAPGSQQGQLGWTVSLSLKPTGQTAWANYTSKHNEKSTPGDIANKVAFTLDSKVVEASNVSETINGDTTISGAFTAKTAGNLANSLKYGALPLSFTELTNSTVSPTLGVDQLKAGLLAGGIGLVLVIIYSLIYYRALGLVTIASLAVSGGLTYAMLVILGKQIGFTLTLAGIAGFIVAVGITADSFVVFFERIKDEVHEGRTARVAIPRAWERSRRTIISADTVSLLAAVTLYYFAAGEVRGFAFTLGLSTLLDLVVVFLFTHPLVSLFSRSAAFGSARFTGLNHVRQGGIALATAGGDGASVNVERAAAETGVKQAKGFDASVPSSVSGSGSAAATSAAQRAAARRGLTRDTSTTTGEESDR